MITNQERKILHLVCRESLLKIVINSNKIKQKTTFQEQINLCKNIQNFSYTESISFVFNKGKLLDEFGVRDFESSFSKVKKYGMAGIVGGMMAGGLAVSAPVGITVAMITMFSFRKATDPCYQVCVKKFMRPVQRKICKYECQVKAAKTIVSDIRSQIGRCSGTPNPERCERSLNKEFIKWNKKLQKEIIMLAKYKQDSKEKEAKKLKKGKM